VKVLIADDHPLMIAGVRRILERHEDIEIVGEARTGPEVMAMLERRRPNVVLLDLRMPGVTVTESIERIRDNWTDVKTVVLSASDDPASIDAALDAGASAYVVKSVNPIDIASVLRQAATAGVYHATRHRRERTAAADAESSVLTDRERAILGAVAAGMTTAAISKNLWVSEHTVKFHLTNIYRKLGVTNRAGAVRYALEHDLAAA
jgi:DNA-binding NarL/FixJ family response regulator